MPDDGFRSAARKLNAFLSPVGDDEASGVLGNLDEGRDLLLFYGLTVSERIDVETIPPVRPNWESQDRVGRREVLH